MGESEIIMTNITKTNNKKSLFEIVTENRNGITHEFVCIDGIKLDGTCGALCTLSYLNEEDKNAAIEFIQKIVDNSDKRGWELVFEVARAQQMAAMHQENGVADDKLEEVEVNGETMHISYKKKAIYAYDATEEVANLNDIEGVDKYPKEAIKTILIERAKNAQR